MNENEQQPDDFAWRKFRDDLLGRTTNDDIRKALAKAYDKTNRKYENDVLRNERYQQGVTRLRKAFDITPDVNVKISEHNGLLIANAGDGKPTVYKDIPKAVSDMLAEVGIDNEWADYTIHYILTGTKPLRPTFASPDTIIIDGITPDGDVVLRLRPGLRKADYENTWQLVSKLLGKPKRLAKPMTEADRNARILTMKNKGMSYSQIADTELPNLSDRTAAVDTIKKIVRRERNRLEARDK